MQYTKPKNNLSINLLSRYLLNERIEQGQNAYVLSAIDQQTKKLVIIKFYKMNEKKAFLIEKNILQELQDCEKFPKIIDSQECDDCYFCVQEYLGLNLFELYYDYPELFSLERIYCLQMLHNKGYLHRDLKPDNILIDPLRRKNQVFLIDFGLSLKCIQKNGSHYTYHKVKTFIGSPGFASVASHKFQAQSYKDDLEAMFYTIMFLMTGSLPWQKFTKTKIQSQMDLDNLLQRVQVAKDQKNLKHFCRGMPSEFLNVIQYIKQLKFGERPDYSYIRNQFKNMYGKVKKVENPTNFATLQIPMKSSNFLGNQSSIFSMSYIQASQVELSQIQIVGDSSGKNSKISNIKHRDSDKQTQQAKVYKQLTLEVPNITNSQHNVNKQFKSDTKKPIIDLDSPVQQMLSSENNFTYSCEESSQISITKQQSLKKIEKEEEKEEVLFKSKECQSLICNLIQQYDPMTIYNSHRYNPHKNKSTISRLLQKLSTIKQSGMESCNIDKEVIDEYPVLLQVKTKMAILKSNQQQIEAFIQLFLDNTRRLRSLKHSKMLNRSQKQIHWDEFWFLISNFSKIKRPCVKCF